MNKMLLKIEYETFLVCADQKDEQALLGILGRGMVVKKEWSMNNAIFIIDEQPKVEFVNEGAILMEKPEPEVQPEETENGE
jgi:predicted transcriptional regulator